MLGSIPDFGTNTASIQYAVAVSVFAGVQYAVTINILTCTQRKGSKTTDPVSTVKLGLINDRAAFQF